MCQYRCLIGISRKIQEFFVQAEHHFIWCVSMSGKLFNLNKSRNSLYSYIQFFVSSTETDDTAGERRTISSFSIISTSAHRQKLRHLFAVMHLRSLLRIFNQSKYIFQTIA